MLLPILLALGVGYLLLSGSKPAAKPSPGGRIDLKALCPNVELPPMIDQFQELLDVSIVEYKGVMKPSEILFKGIGAFKKKFPGEYTDFVACVEKAATKLAAEEAKAASASEPASP